MILLQKPETDGVLISVSTLLKNRNSAYFETWCAEEWGPGEYLGREDDQTEGDQAIDDEVLEVIPPGDEELLRVGV